MKVLGLGLDLVDVPRIRRLLERGGERFTSRVFTADEVAYCGACANAAVHYAARFAAKEAAAKALGTGFAEGVSWKDVEVRRNGKGAPSLVLHGGAARLAEALGVQQFLISLTHTDSVAAASVVAVG